MSILNAFQPLAHIVGKFILDGKEYDMEQFDIDLEQPVDYKNQPQHEVIGGQLHILLTQAADDNIYDWNKQSTKMKDGRISFQTEISSPVLEISFSNAYCIGLHRKINAFTGTKSHLVISAEILNWNGIKHDNDWRK